jgi:hypothetical protein
MTTGNGGSDTHREASTRSSRAADDSPGPDDSTPTTAEEAMDADSDEDGLVDESAYAPTSVPPADR